MDKIKIAIADDHNMVRQTIAHALSHDRKLQVVLQAENGKVLVENLNRYKPDVIILDIEMPVMNGFEVLDHLRVHYPEGKVVVLSMHFDNLIIRDLINRGARGLLPKNADFESLLNAIYEVMATGYFFSKKVNPNLVHELLRQNVILPTFQSGNLELMEAELIDYICRDKLNREIAELMNVSERTVERYKSRLYKKAGVKTSGGLVVYALKNNYFAPENLNTGEST